MFTPIRCPNPDCPRHHEAGDRFFWRNGRYRAECRSHWVACFKCKTCRKSFSRQTYRQDYRDKVPRANATILTLLCSGIGLRQTARVVGVHRNTVTRKFRKIGRQMGFLNANMRKTVDRDLVTLLMDEFESYEGRRNTRPVTIPMVIEKESDFIVDCVSAPIRPRGTMTEKRKRAIARDERRFGVRKDRSKPALERVLSTAASLFRDTTQIEMRSDEKTTYPRLIRAAFADRPVIHLQTHSKLVRDTFNPLFPINHAEAMSRDLNGRLRRKSWLVSKKHERLNLQLELYMAHKNYVRPRYNTDRKTPAQFLGVHDRRESPAQLLAWRQDLGPATPHPFDPLGRRLAPSPARS